MIKADEELGSKGGQVRQQINDQYEKLVSSQGANGRELVDGAVDRKMQQWRATGAEFHNMGDVARLSVLQDFGQNAAHADIVAGMFSTATPVTQASPTEFAGVGAKAAASAPQGGYGHLNDRVEGTLPGTGGGHAAPRSLADLSKDLRDSNPVSDKPRTDTLPKLKQTEEALPEGTFDPKVDPRTATGRVLAQDTAAWNLANPAETKEDYATRSMKAYVNQKVTGVEQPQPIPGTELLNQRREAAEAAARAPSETRGIHLRIGRTI